VKTKPKRSSKAKPKAAKPELRIEYPWGSPFVRRSLVVIATLYFLAVLSEGIRPGKLTGIV